MIIQEFIWGIKLSSISVKIYQGNFSLVVGGLVAKSCPTLAIPWTGACQAPLSMGFSRQEYWSGLPFPSPGDLPDLEIKSGSPVLQADDLPTELCGRSTLEGSEAQKEGGACCIASAWDIYHF